MEKCEKGFKCVKYEIGFKCVKICKLVEGWYIYVVEEMLRECGVEGEVILCVCIGCVL